MYIRERRAATILVATAMILLGSRALAQQSATKRTVESRRTSRLRPTTPAVAEGHPLGPMIAYAQQEQQYLRATVRDFTCRLTKRERIEGVLQDYQYIDMAVREEVVVDGQIVRPMAIYMHFLGPASVADRRIVFVDGQNDGKIVVRNGGRRFEYLVTELDPRGQTARRASLVPVTEIGFTRMLSRMIEVLERHRDADPLGENTRAVRIAGAKINRRPCTLVRITHPRRMAGLEFHVASVFVDDDLHLPVRVEYSDWPRNERDKAPLIAEYTYTEMKLNVNLPEATFSRRRLRSRGD